jgi:hypothetical protein
MLIQTAGKTLNSKNDEALKQSVLLIAEVLLGAGSDLQEIRRVLFPASQERGEPEIKSQQLETAGKTLNSKNENALKQAVLSIAEVLLGAGSDLQEIRKVLFPTSQDGGEPEVSAAQSAENSNTTPSRPKQEVEAGRLSDNVKTATWFDSVRRSLAMFNSSFMELHRSSEVQIERQYGSGSTRNQVSSDLIADLNALLLEYRDNYPGGGENVGYLPPVASYDNYGMYASASEAEAQKPQEVLAQAPQLYIPERLELFMEFDCAAREIIASKANNANQIPFEGVLFRIEEISESAPAKGSDCPLYVPMDVAIAAAKQLNASPGLPLDADESLSCHSDENVVGTIIEAAIRGKDFVVKGFLHPRNQKKKVDLIANNKERLGMSMNAFAAGRKTDIDGKRAYCIETLELLGANILFANRATWQRTRVLAAEIAASAKPEDDEEMSDFSIVSQRIEKLNESINLLVANNQVEKDATARRFEALETQISKAVEVVASQQQIIEGFVTEKREAQLAAQAAVVQQQQESDRNNLIEAVGRVVDEKVATSVQASVQAIFNQMNPRRSPMPLTREVYAGLQPVVASGATQPEAPRLDPSQIELLQCQSTLDGLEENHTTGPRRLGLVRRIKELKNAGVVLPANIGNYSPQLPVGV